MSLWLVRAGRAGEREQMSLVQCIVAAGWDGLPDLTHTTTRSGLDTLLRETFPAEKTRTTLE